MAPSTGRSAHDASASRDSWPEPDHGHDPTHAACHAVHFYEQDSDLCDVVCAYLADGLTVGQSAILIATGAHVTAFTGGLRARGFDTDDLQRRGRLTFLDARTLLSRFMVGTMPDESLFRLHVGSTIARLVDAQTDSQAEGGMRAYGEMVDLLWRDENPAAALRVEALWNDLADRHTFSLLCAYAMAPFYREADGRLFDAVCRQHTHVRRADSKALDAALAARTRELQAEQAHRQAVERALSDALAEAAHANRLKDEFLSTLSHELRTPLNAMLGWLRVVNGIPPDSGATRRALEVIERNARVQLHLVEDLLDVSRLITGKMPMAADPVNLGAVLVEAAESVQSAAAGKAIDLTLRLEPARVYVTGDANRLHQVVWNLLANAIKFTPRHGHIELRLERTASEAVIVVRDSGQGIPPDFLPHAFERFRQADTSTTRKQGGLGLGLAVVRHLVELHGGQVAAASAGEGLGAVFTVTLPVRAEDAADAAAV